MVTPQSPKNVLQSPPRSAIAAAIKQAIDVVFTGGIDQVLTFDVDEKQTIAGKFYKGQDVYDYNISNTGAIKYNETKGRSDSILEGYFSARTIRTDVAVQPAKKAFKCGKGKPCNKRCIQRGFECKSQLDPVITHRLEGVRKAIATGLGAAAVAGGAAAVAGVAASGVAAAQKQKQESAATPFPTEPDPKLPPEAKKEWKVSPAQKAAVIGTAAMERLKDQVTTSNRKAFIVTGLALGVTTAAYLGVNELDERYQIKDKAILKAAGTAYNKLNEYEKIDEQIDHLPISPELKKSIKNKTGAAKVWLASRVFEAQGSELVSIDKKNNFSTFRNPDGGLSSVGSVGSKVITFGSVRAGNAKDFPIYELAFRVNNQYDRKNNSEETDKEKKNRDRKEGLQLIRIAKAAYQEHLRNLPENSFLKTEAWKKDDAGAKRQNIYKKEGFRTLPMRGDYLWAVKHQGVFHKIPDTQAEYMVQLITGRTDHLDSFNKKEPSIKRTGHDYDAIAKLDNILDLIRHDASDAFLEGFIHCDADPVKAGFNWVNDKTVKGGGYFRKLPKGARAATATSRSSIGSTIAKGLIFGGAIAAGGTLAAHQIRSSINDPKTQKSLIETAGLAGKSAPTSFIKQGAASYAKPVAAGLVVAATGGALAYRWASQEGVGRQIRKGQEQAEAEVKQKIAQVRQEEQQRLEFELSRVQQESQAQIKQEVAQARTQLERDFEQQSNELKINSAAEVERRSKESEEHIHQQALADIAKGRQSYIDDLLAKKNSTYNTQHLVSDEDEGIAFAASVRRGLSLKGRSPESLHSSIKEGVGKLVDRKEAQAIANIAPEFIKRAQEIRQQTNRSPKDRWSDTEQALIRQSNRENGISNEMGDIKKRYQALHQQALGKFLAQSSSADHSLAQIDQFDRKLKALHTRMKQEIGAVSEQVRNAQPLDTNPGQKRSDAFDEGVMQAKAKKQAATMLKTVIASVNPAITGLPSISNGEKGALIGKFFDSNRRLFQYKISSAKKLSYSEVSGDPREHADRMESPQSGSDKCVEGTPCKGECIPRGHECLIDLPPETHKVIDQAKTLIDQSAYKKQVQETTANIQKNFSEARELQQQAKDFFESQKSSVGSKAVHELAQKTWETSELPSRKEIAKTAGAIVKDFIKNPIKAARDGMERDRLARKGLSIITGVEMTHMEAAKRGASAAGKATKQFLKENPDAIEEWAIGLSGFASSQVGNLVGGTVGEKAGDLVGAMAARKTINDIKAYKSARAKLNEDEAFKAAGRLQKAKMIVKTSASEAKRMQQEEKEKRENDKTSDIGGWVAGNAAGDVGGAIGKASGIPLAGAALGAGAGIGGAMAANPHILRAKDRVKAGESVGTIAKEAATSAIANSKKVRNIKKAIVAGNNQEAKIRSKVNSGLRAAKAATDLVNKDN